MNLNNIYTPIAQDIDNLENEIKSLVMSIKNEKIREKYNRFFSKKGKYLRPMLLFLSARAITKDASKFDKDLVSLAFALELLHSASLVHDDIIDKDLMRRGQKTLNNIFGNKVAVLTGDTFFSYAFALVSDLFPKEYTKLITGLSYQMCMSELEQASGIDSLESYFSIIEGKTAKFTSVCCELGARYAGADENQIKEFSDFGLYLGMTYQIKDDFQDSDPNALKYITLETAEEYYIKAKDILNNLRPSEYKESLVVLLDYIMAM